MKKIAWCTPFSSASSISEFSHTLIQAFHSVPALSRAFQIDVLSNDNGYRYHCSSKTFSLKNISENEDSIELLRSSYDYFIYNLGNNPENHKYIYDISRKIPGVVILHDYVYQHFLAHEIFTEHRSPLVYAMLMGRHYGVEGLRAVTASQILCPKDARIGPWDSDLSSKFPLTEAIIDSTSPRAIVAHSKFVSKRVSTTFDGPILELRLPGDEKQAPSLADIKTWQTSTLGRRRCTIVMIGHIQRAKQIDFVLNTILSDQELTENVESIIIAGKPSDKQYVESLRAIVHSYAADSLVRFELDVSHNRLQQLKIAADFFINLRHPNTEGGSGSLIEQMACAKPVVVIDSGVFAEAPKGVIKLQSALDEDGLRSAVQKLVTEPELRVALGREAKIYTDELLAKDYIARLLAFVSELQLDKSSDKAKVMSYDETLRVDPDCRSPEPLFMWERSAFAEFFDLISQGQFDPCLLEKILAVLPIEPSASYRMYAFARTLLTVLREMGENASSYRSWLLPSKWSQDEVFVLSTLRHRGFTQLLKSVFDSQQVHVERALNRLSFDTVEIRQLVLERLLDQNVEGKQHGTADTPTRNAELVRLLLEASDTEFEKLCHLHWSAYLDTESYIDDYPDLQYNLAPTHEAAVAHFINHGSKEGRRMRLKTNHILEIQ